MNNESNYWHRAAAQRYSRRTILRRATIGLAGLSSAALLACGSTKKSPSNSGSVATATSANAGGQPQPGGTFNGYVAANLSGLDPMASSSASSGIIGNNLYTTLFGFKTATDPKVALNLEPENIIGTSIESPDGITWTVKIRPDAVFHDIAPVNGHPIAAADIQATFQRAFKIPNNTSISLVNMIDPNQITTPDGTTIVFRLKNVYGRFHGTLAGATQSGAIMPKEALAGSYDPAKTPIGSGPLVLESYTPDVAVNMKKFPNWILKGQPYVDAVKVAIIPDSSQQTAQFTAGHLDSVRPTPTNLPTVKQQNPKATVLGVPSSRSWVYFGHMDHPNGPFANVNVRRALSMAMDRATIAKTVFGTDFSNNGVLPAALGDAALKPDQFGDATQWYKYNPAEAKKLIDATPEIRQIKKFLYPTPTYGAQFQTLCTTVVSMLNALGLQIQGVAIDYNKDFIGGGKGALYGGYADDSLVASTQGVHNDVDTMLLYNYQTGNDHNLPKVSDPQLDAMMAQMLTIRDDAPHLKAAQDIQKYAADKVYFIPLPSEYAYTVVQPWVFNYQYSTAGNVSEGPNTLGRLWIKKS